jgi:hypothetical protein
MITEKQLEIIRKIQLLQNSIESSMDNRLPLIFSKLSDQVIELANQLPLDAKDRAKLLRETITLKQQIAATIINNKEYQQEVGKVITGFKELKNLSDAYFSELIDGFSAKDELYKEILNANITLTKDNLLGAGIRNNFGNAITQVLKENVAGISNRTTLNATLKKFIEGTEAEQPFLNRYIKQTTNDAVMGFNREYIQTVSEDLNLAYYFYAGTVISDSRSFCKSRTGRYFTKKEVQNWSKLGNWNGRMAGTNENTIFTNAGGYNCRHTIWPVTKVQYEIAKRNGTAGLK